MNEKKNVLIGKIGKSVKIKNIHIETGGGADLILYSTMSRMCPEYDFYFIGPNELHKCSEEEYDKLFPNHNVYSAWKQGIPKNKPYDTILEYFKEKNVKPDFAIVFVGMCSNVNIKGFLKKADGNDYSPLMCFQNYTAPILYTLNKVGCPVYTLAEDARYITVNAKDLYNRERLIFTQINGEFETNTPHVQSETDLKMTKTKHKAKYSHLEKIFLMGLDKNWRDNIDIEAKFKNGGNKFIVLSNGCGTAKINCPGNNSSRLPTYKKYIIDNFKGTPYEDTKIYGVWDKEIYTEYPQIQDKLIVNLGDEIAQAKYTLVYSQTPGFVTCKPWEMITLGILPFIHPEYDCHHLLDLPEYLYITDEKDMLNKVNELEADKNKYIELMNDCFSRIKPEYLNGYMLVNGIFGNIAKDLGFKYKFKPGVESIFNHFDKDFIK
jgi:hypothetical protein